jgi:quercetin 2,3-dioxygenase
VIDIRRGADRYRTDVDGVTSLHCFASGAHYDPDNVSFGPVIACDEHQVAPGAGFAAHRHVGVELVSWVLDGTLRHTDEAGRERLVGPGVVQYQRSGAGIGHAEQNASTHAPLHFVQLWLLCDDDITDYAVLPAPVQLRTGRFAVLTEAGSLPAGGAFAFVARGAFGVAGLALGPGDSVRTDAPLPVTGGGELLVFGLGIAASESRE